jgi:hypothetical protein
MTSWHGDEEEDAVEPLNLGPLNRAVVDEIIGNLSRLDLVRIPIPRALSPLDPGDPATPEPVDTIEIGLDPARGEYCATATVAGREYTVHPLTIDELIAIRDEVRDYPRWVDEAVRVGRINVTGHLECHFDQSQLESLSRGAITPEFGRRFTELLNAWADRTVYGLFRGTEPPADFGRMRAGMLDSFQIEHTPNGPRIAYRPAIQPPPTDPDEIAEMALDDSRDPDVQMPDCAEPASAKDAADWDDWLKRTNAIIEECKKEHE